MNITLKKTRGILIDPHARTVTVITIEGRTLQGLYAAIGCTTVDVLRLGEHNGVEQDLWIDDEGAMSHKTSQAFFCLAGCGSFLAGRAVLLGCDLSGDSVSTDVFISTVEDRLCWKEPHEVRFPAPVFGSGDLKANRA